MMVKRGMLSPINGLPLPSTYWKALEDFFQKNRPPAGETSLAVRSMYWMPIREIETVGNPMRTRIENARGKLLYNANLRRPKSADGPVFEQDGVPEVYKAPTEESRQMPLLYGG